MIFRLFTAASVALAVGAFSTCATATDSSRIGTLATEALGAPPSPSKKLKKRSPPAQQIDRSNRERYPVDGDVLLGRVPDGSLREPARGDKLLGRSSRDRAQGVQQGSGQSDALLNGILLGVTNGVAQGLANGLTNSQTIRRNAAGGPKAGAQRGYQGGSSVGGGRAVAGSGQAGVRDVGGADGSGILTRDGGVDGGGNIVGQPSGARALSNRSGGGRTNAGRNLIPPATGMPAESGGGAAAWDGPKSGLCPPDYSSPIPRPCAERGYQ